MPRLQPSHRQPDLFARRKPPVPIGTSKRMKLLVPVMRARSMEALKQKARRGELFFSVVAGYVKVGRDRIVKDPDLRVREAIGQGRSCGQKVSASRLTGCSTIQKAAGRSALQSQR
jgi:hypothetical protein